MTDEVAFHDIRTAIAVCVYKGMDKNVCSKFDDSILRASKCLRLPLALGSRITKKKRPLCL